jgi:hypothetical protein
MKKIKLVKITDDHFNGNHPNGIHEGYIKDGYMIEKPKIGDRFYVYQSKLYSNFSTSIVTKGLDKDNIFKTIYSTYKIEYTDE